jgi:hypothetical protein
MSNFPLYDNLSSNITNNDLTVKQKDEFIKTVSEIDNDGAELIYALIRSYQLDKSDIKNTFILPFDGICVDKDIKFNLADFPIPLRQILYKFIKLHINSIKENSILQETRNV